MRLWDLNSGQPIRAFDGRSGPLNTLSLSRDGQTALSGSEDATLLLWDLTTGDIIRRLEGHSGTVLSTAISPDGRLALSGGADRDVVLWDLDTGEIRYRLPGNETITEGVLTEKGHHGPVWNVAFTPDGQTAISGADDEIIIRWQIDNPEETRTYLRANPSSSIYALAVHPDDGCTLLLGFLDSRIARLHTITGDTTQLFLGHDGRVLALSITPDGRTAVSASSDGTVRQWNLEHGALVRRVGEDLTVPGYATLGATSIDLSPADELGVIGHWTGALSLWAYESGEIVRSLPGHTEALFGGTLFTPDGDRIVSGSGEIFAEAHDTTVRVWDVSGGEELRQFRGHTDKIWDIDVSSDGRYAISAGHDGALRRWNLHTGEGNILLDVAPQAVRAVAFSPDDQMIAAGLAKGSSSTPNYDIYLLDAATGAELGRFVGHEEVVGDLAFSPDGQLLLSGSADTAAIIWDAANGRQLHRLLGHTGSMLAVAFSPDGRRAAIGSINNTAVVWDVTSGEMLRRFPGHHGAVVDLTFTPDGQRLLVAVAEGEVVREWRVDDTQSKLRDWITANRYVPKLTCEQQIRYNIVQTCRE